MHPTDARRQGTSHEPPLPPLPPRTPGATTATGRIRVRASDPSRTQRALAAERRIGAVANLLDDLAPIPGTGARVGLDPIIGLIPFVGDLTSAVMGTWIVLESARFGVPIVVIVRMLMNTSVDFAIGLIPFLGDIADFGFKGNRKNLELFHRHALDPRANTTGSMALVIGVLFVAIGLGWLIVTLLARILSTVVG